MLTELDHITVTATDLDEGAAWVSRHLAVEVPMGGPHTRMSTHNRLLRLGPKLFLEVIAPDPAVPDPPRCPRWFALDDPSYLQSLRTKGPRLGTWVVRTSDIVGAARRSPIPLGTPERVGRGGLEWLITVPAAGSLPEGGAMPTLIQWPEDVPHPAERMPDFGYALARLEVAHPEPERLCAALTAIRLDRSCVEVNGADVAELRAHIVIPGGPTVMLSGLLA
jgi:hypothetical protein